MGNFTSTEKTESGPDWGLLPRHPPPPTSRDDDQYKLVLLGDNGGGKSSLILRFVRGVFYEYQESTIAAAFLSQSVCLRKCTVKFEIWDAAGQERYHSLAPMYYRGAAAAVVVYDIASADAFRRTKGWVQELQRCARADIAIALTGHHGSSIYDTPRTRQVSVAEARDYAEGNGLFFIETCARTAMNVDVLFRAIAAKLTRGRWVDEDWPVQQEGLHQLPLVCRAGRQSTLPAFEHRWWPQREMERHSVWCQFVQHALIAVRKTTQAEGTARVVASVGVEWSEPAPL